MTTLVLGPFFPGSHSLTPAAVPLPRAPPFPHQPLSVLTSVSSQPCPPHVTLLNLSLLNSAAYRSIDPTASISTSSKIEDAIIDYIVFFNELTGIHKLLISH